MAQIVSGIPARASELRKSEYKYILDLLDKLGPHHHIQEENVSVAKVGTLTNTARGYARKRYPQRKMSYTTRCEKPGTRTVLIWWRVHEDRTEGACES